MLRAVIPAEETVALATESSGFISPLFLVAVGLFAILTLVVVLFTGRKALRRDDESKSGTSSSSDSMPDESEWTVSYNPPSRRSQNKKSGSSRSSRSNRPSPSKPGRSSKRSTNRSATSSQSKRSSSGSAAGGSAGASKQSAADGSGETRLYDPATGNPTTDDPTDTDTRIFTGEKSDASGTACPDCGETPPSGTDWEFCPFCGIEL